MTIREDVASALPRYLAGRLPGALHVEVGALERIAVGNSRAMLGVTARFEGAGGQRESLDLVLRVEQGGVFGTDSRNEVRLMRALAGSGIPVARVRWYEADPSVLGEPFFVMDRVPGRGEGASEAAVRESVRLLAQQHELAWRRLGMGFLDVPAVPRDAALLEVARWERVYRDARLLPVPLLDEAAAWLRRKAPEARRIVLVHGDPGPGNFMVDRDRVTAITDWEFAHLGDENEDWVYIAMLRGAGERSPEQWRKMFVEEAGVEIDDESWAYWEAFNLFKGACANLTALRVFCDGDNRNPNMSAVGTSLHLLFVNRLAAIVGSG